ncbi:hypothetical protein STEG23_016765, partial [Scotinomys teguina]
LRRESPASSLDKTVELALMLMLTLSLNGFGALDIPLLRILFRSVLRFQIGLFGVLKSSFLSSFYTLEISPLLDVGVMKIFSHSVDGQSVLLPISFALQKLFSFMMFHLLTVDLSVCMIGLLFRKLSLDPYNQLIFAL